MVPLQAVGCARSTQSCAWASIEALAARGVRLPRVSVPHRRSQPRSTQGLTLVHSGAWARRSCRRGIGDRFPAGGKRHCGDSGRRFSVGLLPSYRCAGNIMVHVLKNETRGRPGWGWHRFPEVPVAFPWSVHLRLCLVMNFLSLRRIPGDVPQPVRGHSSRPFQGTARLRFNMPLCLPGNLSITGSRQNPIHTTRVRKALVRMHVALTHACSGSVIVDAQCSHLSRRPEKCLPWLVLMVGELWPLLLRSSLWTRFISSKTQLIPWFDDPFPFSTIVVFVRVRYDGTSLDVIWSLGRYGLGRRLPFLDETEIVHAVDPGLISISIRRSAMENVARLHPRRTDTETGITWHSDTCPTARTRKC